MALPNFVPFEPDAPVDQPSLNVPLAPPLVGEGSPWQPSSAENRDRILDWWRAWFREIFFPWVAAWTAWWLAQWVRLATFLNNFLSALLASLSAWQKKVEDYIEENAVEGPPGPSNVLSIGTVSTLENEEPATASITGTSPSQVLNLGLPKGDQGIQGPPGVADQASIEFSTPLLAPQAVHSFNAEAELPRMSEWYRIAMNKPCWVRVYASEAQMIADASRPINQPIDITTDFGCFLDFVAIQDNQQKVLTPAVTVTDIGEGVWVSIKNIGDSSATLNVEAEYLIIREA